MSSSSMLLIGVGTTGSQIARGISRAFGDSLNYVLLDTDAATGEGEGDFILLGGDRLSGRGAAGNVVEARLATEDSIQHLDPYLAEIRLAVIVTALGGGTGGGGTLETAKHLTALGIPSIVFATTPFLMEGEERQQKSRGVMPLIEENANATFFLPMDKLVQSEDNMAAAMRQACDSLASGITFFWRLIERPGYLRLDADRIRHLITGAGRGRFTSVTVQGTDRATQAVEKILSSEILSTASAPVQAILCGVLAGEDLRLSEIGRIADGIRETFGNRVSFELGTVNDEMTFCGRISVVVMLFEANGKEPGATGTSVMNPRRTKRPKGALGVGPAGRGRFNNAEPTYWNGEDLDMPTFIRRNISLDF